VPSTSPESAADQREPEEPCCGRPFPPRDDARERQARSDRGEAGEVVVAEERRLPPASPPRAEDVDPEELHQPDGRRDPAPEDERAEHDREILCTPHQQRDGEREERVLAELREADGVVGELGVVNRGRAEELEPQPDEEQRSGDPHDAAGAQAPEAGAPRRDDRRDHDREDGDVREADVDGGRPGRDGQVRLIALVEEDERDGQGDDERAGGLPIRADALANAGQRRVPDGGVTAGL
jgi:hypothetical protein